MRFLIVLENELIGMSGHIKVTANSDVDAYVEKFGFTDSDSALEAAEALGLTDAKIKAINAGE